MEDIEQKAIELIEKFEQLAVDIAPDALELALLTARIAAGAALTKQIFIITLFIATSMILWKNLNYIHNWSKMEADERRRREEELVIPIGKSVVMGLLAFITLLPGVLGGWFFTIWPTMGIFFPEVWIAKEVLGW